MASQSSYNKSKRRTRGEDNELVPVRSGIFYGIETQKVDQQKSNLKRDLTIVPNITFYSSYTKIMMDFSDVQNNQEKSDVKTLFDLLISGLNFTLTNSSWKNPTLDKSTFSLDGTYRFTKIVDNIIFADVILADNTSPDIARYDKEFFISLPIVEFTSIVDKGKKQTKSNIFNHLGKNSKNSFSYLGARVGDYITIQNKTEKYLIESITVDNEGKETLTVIGDLGTVTNVGSPYLLTLNQSNSSKIQLTDDNIITGKCDISVNGSVVECVDNTTLLQSKLREDLFNQITTRFYPGEFCIALATNDNIQDVANIVLKLQAENAALYRAKSSNQNTTTSDSTLFSSTNLRNTLFTT